MSILLKIGNTHTSKHYILVHDKKTSNVEEAIYELDSWKDVTACGAFQ